MQLSKWGSHLNVDLNGRLELVAGVLKIIFKKASNRLDRYNTEYFTFVIHSANYTKL